MRVIRKEHINRPHCLIQRKISRKHSWRIALRTKSSFSFVSLMKISAQVSVSLKRRLGAVVDLSEKGRWAASFDSSKISFLPDAVITPRREADIGVVLELANK